jgi:asparagine synthase (glutamine-hydrolysing)
MCGLFGIINLDKRPVDLKECTRTLAILNDWGPDGSWYHHQEHVLLGHTRLSIIDVAGGAQPIYSEDGRFLVIFNGEIYNHEELRPALLAAGHRFKTRSDTEVLVHLFEYERERFLGKLNGMFAFAIFDTKTGSLFLARSRMTTKCQGFRSLLEGAAIPASRSFLICAGLTGLSVYCRMLRRAKIASICMKKLPSMRHQV